MIRDTIIEELKAIITDYLKNQNIELVDLVYRYEGHSPILRVLVDRPEGGISISECASFNSDISGILEEKDILKEEYNLEVSSPGLDRSLKTKSDFSRCLNRNVRIFISEPINGRQEWEGTILRAEDEAVYIGVLGKE
jgi:ribosome maturation factor RimP